MHESGSGLEIIERNYGKMSLPVSRPPVYDVLAGKTVSGSLNSIVNVQKGFMWIT